MRSTTHQIEAAPNLRLAGDGGSQGAEATWRFVLFALLGIFALNFLLRVFFIRYQFVNGDEAVRALTALGVLRGERLYVDVITDKPPGATLFYAAVLRFFPHSMPAVHIAAILWNFGTAVAIYALGARFYSRKTGLWASLLFVYFSASYHTQDAMAANTELLMCLPYTLSVYFYLRAHTVASEENRLPETSPNPGIPEVRSGHRYRSRDWAWLVAAGSFAGIAAIFKQVGVLVLVFFALNEALQAIIDGRLHWGEAESGSPTAGARVMARVIRILARLSLIAIGAGLLAAAVTAWLWGTGALPGFWRNAIQLGAFYVGSLPVNLWIKFLFFRSFGYVLLTAALWVLAALGLGHTLMLVRLSIKPEAAQRNVAAQPDRGGATIDTAMAMWCIVSLSGVFTSGRFYGHYFIPVLPALSLLGARGIARLTEQLAIPSRRGQARAQVAIIVLLLIFSLFRFHHRTAILAYETITGRRTGWSEAWGMTRREREAEEVANTIRSLGVNEGQPLYIWGYALDVYWRSGCIPASRYLTPYYVTGGFYPEVPAGAEPSGASFWQEARSQFVDDLKRTRPRLILNLDEPLDKLPYPDIVDFVGENYRVTGSIGPDPAHQFVVYTIRDRE